MNKTLSMLMRLTSSWHAICNARQAANILSPIFTRCSTLALTIILSLFSGCLSSNTKTPSGLTSNASETSERGTSSLNVTNSASEPSPTRPVATKPAEEKTVARTSSVQAKEKLRSDTMLLGDYIDLKRHSEELSRKLKATLVELYQTKDNDAKSAMISAMLGDPMDEIRSAALDLALSQARTGNPIRPDDNLRVLVRLLLDDQNGDIRASAAVLLAVLKDERTVELIVPRLKRETSSSVRSAYIMSLGAMRDARAVDVVLDTLTRVRADEALEAVKALAKLLDASALSPEKVDLASEIIAKRYGQRESAEFRSATLAIMRRLARDKFIPVMKSALSDESAQVKLEAIRGLEAMKASEASTDIAKLTSDSDRGIRQAALETLGAMSATETLPTVLNRTDPATESDPAVRDRAWKTALGLMNGADRNMLRTISDSLANRPDALEYRIRILEMLSSRLTDEPEARCETDILLAEAMIQSGRPAQAAEILESVYRESPPEKFEGSVWLMLVRSLLIADDESALSVMAKRERDDFSKQAIELLNTRLAELNSAKSYQTLTTLADQAVQLLASRLSNDEIARFEAIRDQAIARQKEIDTEMVYSLAAKLTSEDAAISEKAAEEIAAMATRAAGPMISLIKVAVQNDNKAMQQKLLTQLVKLAPELTGFELNATTEQKLEVIAQWQKLH